jgi:heavy metal translocating P-type ATPase
VPVAALALCDLCGLPAGQGLSFCCAGCANVYRILEESGLLQGDFRSSELYQASLKMGLISNAAPSSAAPVPAGTERAESVYRLSGLWCSSCGWLIEHALRKERGVISADVSFTSDLLRVSYYPQYLAGGRLISRIQALGYGAAPYTAATDPSEKQRRDLLLRTGIAAFLWMNVMLFSLVVYASYFEGISGWAHRAIPPILMVLATPAIFYSGRPILRTAFAGLRHGYLRMETLVATGILAAYFYSALQIVLGGKHFYFDTACAIVTLVLTGKALEQGAKERTTRDLSLLHQLMPAKARIVRDGQERFVSASALCAGLELLVKPGERIPADGVVVGGSSTTDESVVTGESVPLAKCCGDPVIGGSINGAGVLTVRVTRSASEGTLAQIVRSVEKALSTHTSTERSVDRAARLFVPVVMMASVVVAAICLALGFPATEVLMRSIAVLVIACPCALGIATPLATTNAIGQASRLGVLLRDATVLDGARKLDVMILDKTGTMTEGHFQVHECWWHPDWELLGPRLLASLESVSEHPVGRAIVEHVSPTSHPSAVEIHKGQGIQGTVEGHRVFAGGRQWIGRALDQALEAQTRRWLGQGLTVVFCRIDDELAGVLALGDRLRPEAHDLVVALKNRGIRPVLLSGDAQATTAHIASQLGIEEFRGEVLPAEKQEQVERYRGQGLCVGMVGDGINDAPALAAADLGFAMGSGTDLAAYTAPVVLMSSSLLRIPDVLALAARTQSIVQQNLFWAFFYNAIGIPLAAAGILSPIWAAGAMVLSSLSVVANSLRLAGGASPKSATLTPSARPLWPPE